ncbi:MAG: GTP-binding protein [Methanomassiliicoccales archaeon]|nr:MAG: GTP-binding protein [Methanomassiliicoccales archaeon]
MSLDYGNRLKLKICLVGDGAVGKTSLVRKFVFDEFSEKYLTTIGTKISKREMTMPDPDGGVGVDIDMAIWDIIGQHGFRRLLQEAYFFGVDGIIAVCDMTREETLSGLEDWLQRVEEVAGTVPIIAAANKSDLQTHRNIEEPDLREMMKKFNAEFLLTSAKTGENVEKLFDYLANVIVEQRRARKKEGALSSRPEAKET